jgi:hypothetical protein
MQDRHSLTASTSSSSKESRVSTSRSSSKNMERGTFSSSTSLLISVHRVQTDDIQIVDSPFRLQMVNSAAAHDGDNDIV